MRPRGSIVGPLILITIGVVFLLRTVWPGFSVFDVFAVYWPYLLIAWGVLQIIEISVRARSRGPIPRNGITAGGWFLVLLICLVGFTMFEVHGPETWWRRVSFNQGMDWFGEAHDYSIASQTQAAGNSPHLVLQDFRGNAKIVGGDVSQIELSGHKTIRALKDAEARRADEDTPVVLMATPLRCVRTNKRRRTTSGFPPTWNLRFREGRAWTRWGVSVISTSATSRGTSPYRVRTRASGCRTSAAT